MTFQDLEKAQEEAILSRNPHEEELNRAKAKFNKAVAPIEQKFKDKLEAYFDAVLLDSTGATIKVGDDVTDGKYTYKVGGRSLQCIFGQLINNPGIQCHKYMKDKMGKYEFSFGRHGCKELTIVKKS